MTDTAHTSTPAELAEAWIRLWNGADDLAVTTIAPTFRLHAAMIAGSDEDVRDPHGLLGWISLTRSAISDLSFTVEVGPLIDGDRIALRWLAEGHYSGGFPGAKAAPGTPVSFTGTDLLRVEDGRLAEYWTNSDVHVLMAQLGVGGA